MSYPGFPGDVLNQAPPGIRRISPADILGDRWIGLRVSGEVTLRVDADVSVQSRVKRHRDGKTGEVHLLALGWQRANGANALAHKLPVGQAICAGDLLGLGASVRHEGDEDQPGDQGKRQEQASENPKGGK